jgi:hypothetical protein
VACQSTQEDAVSQKLGLMGMMITSIFVHTWEVTASAKDIRFISKEPADERPIWAPSVAMIDRDKDLQEPLYFILENPTDTDHEFAAYGLFEIVPEQIADTLKSAYYTGPETASMQRPIHVLVEAKSTLKIAVVTEWLIRNRNMKAEYLFFCPKHKDVHLGGVIFVE